MRFSIGSKIFGIAVFLALVMVVAALLSETRVREAEIRIDVLAERLLPLADKVGKLRAMALREEMRFRRLLAAPLSAAGIDEKALAAFDAHAAAIDAKATDMRADAEAAERGLKDAKRRLILTDVMVRLETLIVAHDRMHALARRVYARHSEGRNDLVAELGQLFESENDAFQAADEALTQEIRELAEEVAKDAEVDEKLGLAYEHVVTGVAVVLGLLLASVMARALVRPIKNLRDASKAVEAGDLNQHVDISGRDELADLSGAFNSMVDQLRQKEKTEALFGRYVDPRVVQNLIDASDEDAADIAAGDKREATVMFSDVAGYTGISERLTPGGLVRLMNAYFNMASEPIAASGGLIDKFIGDAVMAFWCPPFAPAADIGRLACAAALKEAAMVDEFQKQIPDITGLRKDVPSIAVRIGLATGDVVVGSVGSDRKRSFTVIGDTVNLSSRLEGANKIYGTKILICERTREMIGDAFTVRELDNLAVVGKTEAVRVFELVAEGPPAEGVARALRSFAEGLACYRRREWDAAASRFDACLAAKPDDPPARAFLARIERFKADPPGPDWDGVWQPTSK
jgi:class 3 adenylate cyclase